MYGKGRAAGLQYIMKVLNIGLLTTLPLYQLSLEALPSWEQGCLCRTTEVSCAGDWYGRTAAAVD
jgi:hypothetical protein